MFSPLLRIENPMQLRWFGHVSRIPLEILAKHVLLATRRENGPEVVQGPGGVRTSPTLLGPAFVCSQQNYLRLLLTVKYFRFSWSCCPRDPPPTKSGYENERKKEKRWNFVLTESALVAGEFRFATDGENCGEGPTRGIEDFSWSAKQAVSMSMKI